MTKEKPTGEEGHPKILIVGDASPRINQYEQHLSPHEVSSYVHWFRRYLNGVANPKWVDGHLIALLGLLDEQACVSREKLKRLVEIAEDNMQPHTCDVDDFIQQFKEEIGG